MSAVRLRSAAKFAVCCVAVVLGQAAAAATVPAFAGYQPVPLRNGFNRIALAGQRLTVAYAWRENYNAHGFAVATVYAEAGDGGAAKLLLVPFFGEAGNALKERYEMVVAGGADCQLRDIRLLTAGNDALLVQAWRDVGAGYAQVAPVHFDVYRFERNSGEIPGRPPFDFRFERRIEARRAYCDVGQAVRQELGIGPDEVSAGSADTRRLSAGPG